VPILGRIADWARRIRYDAIALWFAARDPRTPLGVRVLLWLVVLYALSPIDLIPDFIPVLGYLDEALLLPAAIWLAMRLVPAPVLEDGRRHAQSLERKPRMMAGAVLIGSIWILIAAIAVWLVWTRT
jgi:uncharacterized membrane protein YkvA (DUF1232 family)